MGPETHSFISSDMAVSARNVALVVLRWCEAQQFDNRVGARLMDRRAIAVSAASRSSWPVLPCTLYVKREFGPCGGLPGWTTASESSAGGNVRR
jgi:hypothetical protein